MFHVEIEKSCNEFETSQIVIRLTNELISQIGNQGFLTPYFYAHGDYYRYFDLVILAVYRTFAFVSSSLNPCLGYAL